MKFTFDKFIVDLEMREKKNAKNKERFLEKEDTPQRRLLKKTREWTREKIRWGKK
jgi:hypothetical protein